MEQIEQIEKKLNWKEACELLGCKKSHFYNLVHTGKIPGYKFGMTRGVWVYEKDCLAYLNSRQRIFKNDS